MSPTPPSGHVMPVPISCFGWPQTYYMPMLNPDGYEANRRGNGNNADLNRDFPTVTGGSGGYPRLGLDFDLDRGTHKKTKPNFIPPMRASLFRNSAVLPCSSACHFFAVAWPNTFRGAVSSRSPAPTCSSTRST